MRWALFFVSLFVFTREVHGQCEFLTSNCVFPDETDKGFGGLTSDVYCYLSGEKGEPRLYEVLAQKYDTPEHDGCPTVTTRGLRFVVFL